MRSANFLVWRGDSKEGRFAPYATEAAQGMVVLDAILKIQAETLDLSYLRKWANNLGVADLLEKALQQSTW